MRGKSPNPALRTGIFNRLEEVPARYRLDPYQASYHDRDVWQEYSDAREKKGKLSSKSSFIRCERAGRYWKSHMENTQRHHALATPQDVEDFFSWLLSTGGKNMVVSTSYTKYWEFIEDFFSWLQWHTKHPHNYHVALMAVIENPDGVVGDVWDEKLRYSRVGSDREVPDWRKSLQKYLASRDRQKEEIQ